MWNGSIIDYYRICFSLPSPKYHGIAFVLVNVPFVLPMCFYILYLGVQQWRSRAKISHTDLFTYNMVMMQLINIMGTCVVVMNWIFQSDLAIVISTFMLSATYTGTVIFQIFTCLERYLAVVHPVIYLGLKSQSWILIRNSSCGFVWLQCIIQSVGLSNADNLSVYCYFTLLGLSFCLLIVLFCNCSILCVLIRPQPGDGAKGNKTKHKALYTITAITGTLLFRFAGDLLSLFSFMLLHSNDNNYFDKSCALYFSVIWFTLPSMLVLPMLFLQHKKKLLCFKTKKQHAIH